MRFPRFLTAFAVIALLGASARAAEPYLWRSAQVVGGGFVSGIVVHPKAKGLIYCRTDIGGAYRWDPKQKQWVSISIWIDAEHWNYTGTESLAVDPSDPNTVFIAAGSYTSDWAGNGAILVSHDRGDNWKVVPLPIKLGGNEDGRNSGERLAVDPNDGRVLYLGSRRNGLWRSTDGGLQWAQVESFPQSGDSNGQGLSYVTFDAAGGRAGKPTPGIYVGSSTGASLYRSTDAGKTWDTVAGAPAGVSPHRAAWDTGRHLFLTYGNGPGPNGIGDGSVWKFDAATGAWADVTPVKPGENGDTFGYSGVCVDQQHPSTIMVSTLDRWARGDDIFRSLDDGKTWESVGKSSTRNFDGAPWLTFKTNPAPNGPLGHWTAAVAIDPFDSNHAMYTTGWGMFVTHDFTRVDRHGTVHWTPGAKGVEELVVNEVVSPSAGAAVLTAVWDVDGFRHTDLDHSPEAGTYDPSVGRNTSIDVAGKNPDVVARVYGGQILGHDFGKMTGGAYSLDNGVTWKGFATDPDGGGDGTIAVSADGSTFVWSPEKAMPCVSSDHSATWTAAQGLPAKAQVAADRVDPQTFYAYDSSTGTVYLSSDAGRTFTAGAINLPHGDGEIKAVIGRAHEFWLATSAGLYRSSAGGKTCLQVSTVQHAIHLGFGKPAPGADYPAVYLNGTVDGVYGIYRSTDAGASWVRINDDHHQYGGISSVTGDPKKFGRVYVGSTSFGVPYGDPVK